MARQIRIVAATLLTALLLAVALGPQNVEQLAQLARLENIINEIPSYSFTVGDLHAHLMALPFFMLALILIYDLFTAQKLKYDLMFAFGVTLGSLGIINPWDFVSLTIVVSLAVLIKIIALKKIHYKFILKRNYEDKVICFSLAPSAQ